MPKGCVFDVLGLTHPQNTIPPLQPQGGLHYVICYASGARSK